MRTRTHGSGDGSSLEGELHPIASWSVSANKGCPVRPYLYMYAHSNEVEEIGVISLTGVNIENNPEMEALLGVRF